MEMVRHNKFGVGEVIGREVISGFTFLNVRFENGREMRFSIPQSFNTGALEPLGSLKDEVEQAIAEKKAKLSAPIPPKTPAASPKKASAKYVTSSPVAAAFEAYLIKAGYKIETDSGNPSTVYSYINAVESVLTEEGISWDSLKTNICVLVPKYDVGGEKQLMGAKSNRTVICALKAFEDFTAIP